MAIKYTVPVKDYASQERQDECKNYARNLFIERIAKSSFHPVEEYEKDHYEVPTDSDNRFIVCVLIGVFVLMSLYLVNTSAVAGDCTMPATPLSIIGAA